MGISKVFWGVTESRHLVDIINQVDGVEDIDEEDRLGQPMLEYGLLKDWGNLRFFYLPYFRERTFAGKEGRLRGELAVNTNDAIYANSKKEFYPSFAVRYNHFIDNWDFALSHFHGTGREPKLVLQNNELVPFYEIIDQTGLEAQYTYDAWLLKLESMARAGQGDYFFATVTGFEYTFFGTDIFVEDAYHDLGILLEYQYDGRDFNAPATAQDNDIFLGARYVFNDVNDTEILAGVSTDLSDASQLAVVEFSRRINNNWKIEVDGRFFINQDQDSPIKQIEQDDFVQLRLAYYF